MSDSCLCSAGKYEIPFSALFRIDVLILYPFFFRLLFVLLPCPGFFVVGSLWVWLKVILHAGSLSDQRGGMRQEKGHGRAVRIAEEGDGGSRADRLSTVQRSHHFSLQT